MESIQTLTFTDGVAIWNNSRHHTVFTLLLNTIVASEITLGVTIHRSLDGITYESDVSAAAEVNVSLTTGTNHVLLDSSLFVVNEVVVVDLTPFVKITVESSYTPYSLTGSIFGRGGHGGYGG